MLNRIVFAAGGTGGHIYPAIAVSDELKKMNDKIEVRFIGAKGRIEEKIVPSNGYKLKTIDLRGFYRSMSPKNISIVLKFLKAEKMSKIFLKEFKPEIVFGTGGFVSGPVLRSAVKLGIKTVIQEGNSYPGVTVKWLSPKVDKVIINFEKTASYLKRKDNISVMSYPVRQNLKRYSKEEALAFFGFETGRKTLFVFGGSQGAHLINEELIRILPSLAEKNIQLIWQSGVHDFDKASAATEKFAGIKVLQYIDKIDYAYSACDLVLCRAGVSTVMELASFGCAVIFVPFALASENHQEKNARTLINKNAAEMILDKELPAKLGGSVTSLIFDEAKLADMRKNISGFADRDAARNIAQMLNSMVINTPNSSLN